MSGQSLNPGVWAMFKYRAASVESMYALSCRVGMACRPCFAVGVRVTGGEDEKLGKTKSEELMGLMSIGWSWGDFVGGCFASIGVMCMFSNSQLPR